MIRVSICLCSQHRLRVCMVVIYPGMAAEYTEGLLTLRWLHDYLPRYTNAVPTSQQRIEAIADCTGGPKCVVLYRHSGGNGGSRCWV